MIGLFFWLHNPALLIWNWRTGKLVVRCEASPEDEGVDPQRVAAGYPQLPPATWDMGFLTNRTYIINSIQGRGLIHIYAFDGDSEPDVAPTLCATLAMPDIQPMNAVHHFATHSAPFLSGETTANKPFTTDERTRIYMMTITYGPQMRYHVFVKSEYLESLVPSKDRLTSAETYVPPLYHWDEWGPDNTRFIENHVHYQWLRLVIIQRSFVIYILTPPFADTCRAIESFFRRFLLLHYPGHLPSTEYAFLISRFTQGVSLIRAIFS